jgi:peroxiredoxin
VSSGSGPGADEDRPDLLRRLDPERRHAPAEPARDEPERDEPGRDEPARDEPTPDRPPPASAQRPPRDRPRPSMVTLAGAEAVDTRRYGWMIGIIGLIVLAIFSVYLFATRGLGETGVTPGQRLHFFAAPLAATTLTGSPNLSPPCTPARHDPRALNLCIMAHRGPVVLSFFSTGSGTCERQVDALQALSARFHRAGVQFAAVAVNADRASTRAAIRAHHWTIPVAYDEGGAVGGLYGVAVCPMAELAARGGIVRDRLIGGRWTSVAALEPRVAALAARGGSG